MLKKIILTLVLLIFAQQEFYGMEWYDEDQWETINNWVNTDLTKKGNQYPKLWWLWAITDNVPIQYGSSKIWKHGEAYYGLSNGIGFFPSILNFGWLKIGIIDAHINVINLILDYFKFFVAYMNGTAVANSLGNLLVIPFLLKIFCDIHIFSIKILNCIKIKLKRLFYVTSGPIGKKNDSKSTSWYIVFDNAHKISWWYAFWSPRIEINISEIINYFFKCK